MANPLVPVSACRRKISCPATSTASANPNELFPAYYKPVPGEKVSLAVRKNTVFGL